ncbi:3-deoxy-manno-octulosonate cytidylyltransferase [Acidiphilium sp. MT5]
MSTPIILIPARLGSTRLPNKPLADIHGSPMIVHVLRRARQAALGPVVVACAEPAIAEAITADGGTAILTDPDLPSGSDRIHAALQHFDPDKKYNIIINLQGDLPTIDPAALHALLSVLAEPTYDIATLVAPITTEAERHAESVVKVACAFSEHNPIATALYFSRAAIPSGPGPLWHHIGVYAYRRAALDHFVASPPSPLEQREKLEQLRALELGLRIGAARIAKPPFGVDTLDDLHRAREELAP